MKKIFIGIFILSGLLSASVQISSCYAIYNYGGIKHYISLKNAHIAVYSKRIEINGIRAPLDKKLLKHFKKCNKIK